MVGACINVCLENFVYRRGLVKLQLRTVLAADYDLRQVPRR